MQPQKPGLLGAVQQVARSLGVTRELNRGPVVVLSNQNMEPIRIIVDGKPFEGVRSITRDGYTITFTDRNTNGNDRNTTPGGHNPRAAGSPGGCTCRTCTLGRAFPRAAAAAGARLSAIPAAHGAAVKAIEAAQREAQARAQRQGSYRASWVVPAPAGVPAIPLGLGNPDRLWLEELELPQVHQELPLLGQRAVRVSIDNDSEQLQLLSVVRNTQLELLDQATCSFNHAVPAEGCGCGFWAIKPGTKEQYHGIHATVELSGRVIEGDVGYRAQWQRILELHLPKCMLCQTPRIERIGKFSDPSAATCHMCKRGRSYVQGIPFIPETSYTPSQIAKTSPVPVFYADGTRVD